MVIVERGHRPPNSTINMITNQENDGRVSAKRKVLSSEKWAWPDLTCYFIANQNHPESMSGLVQFLRNSKFVQSLQEQCPEVYKIAYKGGIKVLSFLELPRYCFCMVFGKVYVGVRCLALQSRLDRAPFMRRAIRLQIESHCPTEPMLVLEIGSWAGESAILWGQEVKGIGHVYCIDPWLPFAKKAHYGMNSAIEMMDEIARKDMIFPLFCHNIKSSGLERTVIPFRGCSEDVLPLLMGSRFDLVFVDGSHAYSDFYQDLNLVGNLVKEGGILCGDDLELQADQVDLKEMELNCEKDFVLDRKTGKAFHPGVCLGVHRYFGRRISCYEGFWVVRKIQGQWVDVRMI